jgi:hypothetical protein
MQDNQSLYITGEYYAFDLPDWIREDSEIIATLRQFARTGKRELLAPLQRIINWESYRKNLIPIVGRAVSARRAAGDFTYSGEIDWGALGSNNTTFSNASTQLTTEVFRKQASSQAFDGHITYIDWFIASGDVANQTFREFGAFIDGTGSANSGQAFSLLNTGGWVKSGSMFISGKYTWS